MKRPLLFIFTLLGTGMFAQEHFAGINTSRRTGIINASINPAELTNLKNKYEVNIFNFSANVSNNKITFGDLVGGSDMDFEDMLFEGNEAVDMKADIEILGPSFAFKIEKWAFAITSAAKVKADIKDVDTGLGRALTSDADALTIAGSFISSGSTQKVTGTSWGEIGFSAARDIFENDSHKFSGGLTLKLIFPGSYANISASQFRGDIGLGVINPGDVVLRDAYANVNVAYSGSLADGFTDAGNFTDFFAGGLNGFGADFGANYQWKDPEVENGYKVNAGFAVRNIGSMTFKDDNNVSKNYRLENSGTEEFNLSQFEGVDNLTDIETLLQNDPNVDFLDTEKDFKVKHPAVLSTYADVKVYNKWYVTGFWQQRLGDENKVDQIATQNVFTVTPRYSGDWFEAYAPISTNEISGFTAGIGFRLGGFYIGSGSILSAALGDTTQADAYLGFRLGF